MHRYDSASWSRTRAIKARQLPTLHNMCLSRLIGEIMECLQLCEMLHHNHSVFLLVSVYEPTLLFQLLTMRLRKIDELSTLIRGIHYMDSINPTECFFYTDAKNDDLCAKHDFDFRNPYPYLCVNVGSGVSILLVDQPNSFKRVGGTRYVSISLLLQNSMCYVH